MKRFFSYIGASLVAIAALSSCNKEIENPSSEASNGIQFAITASSVDTKTSIDGFKTSWVANDQLNITHAIAGSTTYITDGSFSISEANLATNKFDGTLKSNLEEGSSYDWYALYPYTKNDYTYIGHSKGAIQNGNNSTAHLCETLCPLYGVAKNVNSSEPVSFDMQHLAAVVEITVTNETDADLTVKNITFASSDEDIVGSYIIDFKGDNVTYAASGEKYVSKVATLNVTNGDAIAKNGSAKFYIPIKPHVAEAGSKIVINVNGYEKEIPLTKDVAFKAGTVKKIGFKCDRVSASASATFDFTDPTSLGLTAGDITKPIVSENISLTTANGTASTNTRIFKTANNKFELRAYNGSTLSFKAPDSYIIKSIVFSGSSINACSVDVGEFSSGTWTGANQSVKFSATNTLKISKIIVLYVKGEPTTSIIADNIANVSARGITDGELKYTIENPIDGTTLEASCDESVVDVVLVENGKVLYSVSKNTSNNIRTGRITLTYGNVSKDISVSQNAAQFKVSRSEVELEATSNASTSVTITSDFDWIADKTGDGFNFTPDTYTWAEDGKETLTITALSDNASSEGTKSLGTISVKNTETKELIEITVKQKSSHITTQNTLKYTYSSNEGWTINGGIKKNGYHALLGSTTYILSPEFTFTKITSITIKARTYGGKGNNNTIKITYGDKDLGTILPTDSNLKTYSLTNLATLSGKGSIKFAAPSSSSSNGPGISEITIVYE